MKKNFFVLLVMFSFVCACVKFSPMEITRSLPNDIADRNNIIETPQWREHLDELMGVILTEKLDAQGAQQYLIGIDSYLLPNARPVFRTYSGTEGTLLEILVDNSADAKLSYLAFGGATMSSEQKMSFCYSDVSDIWIDKELFDRAALSKEAERPQDPSVQNRWVIQGALLSSIQKKTFTKVQGGITKTITGVGLSAEGQICHSTSKFVKDYAIHLTLRHLDLFRGTPAQIQQRTAYFVRRERPAEELAFRQMLRKNPLPEAELKMVAPEGVWIEKLKKQN